MTKREMFTNIKSLLSDNAEVVAFCDHEIELLSRKSSGTAKPTKTQIENETHKANILAILSENDAPMTISEMMEDSRLAGLKNQRVSALVTQLKNAGTVVRTEIKKKAYFSLAEDETEAE